MELISSGTFDAWLEQGHYLLLDLRSQSAYQAGHIADARNLPWPVSTRQLQSLPRIEPVLVYCEHGGNSISVCRRLVAWGWQTKSLVGGIAAYHGKYLHSAKMH